MLRCSQCGRVNREGSLFCQECGKRLAEAAPKPAAGPVCASCGTVNSPGMNFCKMCGTALPKEADAAAPPPLAVASTVAASSQALGVAATMAPGAPAAASAPTPASVAPGQGKLQCPSCAKPTPVGFQFCQHCGQRVTPPAAASPSPAPAPAQPSPRPLTPPAGVAKIALAQQPVPRVSSPDALAATVAPTTARFESSRPAPKDEPVFGKLVQINRDGSDGDVVTLKGEVFDVGRSEGALRFEEDLFMAPRHIRLLLSPGRVVLTPIDRVNGVYIKVRGGADLETGDQLLLGKELLRFEIMSLEEQSQAPIYDQGVRLLGSVVRNPWGRLRQLTGSGTSGDLWHLTRDEYVLGREEGDLVFSDDEFMSRRHAALRKSGVKTRIEDFGSSNGTFLRVRRERTLSPGDVLRMGDQLMRFEA